MKKFLFLGMLILAIGTLFITSCNKENLSDKKELLSFMFEPSKNPQLDRNYQGLINGFSVTTKVPFTTNITLLFPTVEISPGATLEPAANVTDFTNPVIYTVRAPDGTSKIFNVSVEKNIAPYIGKWASNAMDYGNGLMKLNSEFTTEGNVTLEFTMILTNEKDNTSIKGTFNPISKPDTDIMITQTYIWSSNNWINKEDARTFMYHINSDNTMTFYYCSTYPKTNWLFQINLTKE